jgi:hypothetical protein
MESLRVPARPLASKQKPSAEAHQQHEKVHRAEAPLGRPMCPTDSISVLASSHRQKGSSNNVAITASGRARTATAIPMLILFIHKGLAILAEGHERREPGVK